LGGIPPLVTVLITISAVVAASLVAWFMWSSTRAATLQPVLEVTSAYVSGTGPYAVSFVIRNVGAAQISSVALDEISCEATPGSVVAGTPAGCTLSPTTPVAASCRATFTSSISDGSTCYARVRVTHTGSTGSTTSAVTLTFKVAKP